MRLLREVASAVPRGKCAWYLHMADVVLNDLAVRELTVH